MSEPESLHVRYKTLWVWVYRVIPIASMPEAKDDATTPRLTKHHHAYRVWS